MDTIVKMKAILEELQYRTDQKSPEELYRLALELFELAAARRYSGTNSSPNAKPASTRGSDMLSSSSREQREPAREPSTATAPPETAQSAREKIEESKREAAQTAKNADEHAQKESLETAQINRREDAAGAPPEPVASTAEAPHTASTPAAPDATKPKLAETGTGTGTGKKMKIGFNDRFAFINKLFHGDAEEYNQVIKALEGMQDLHRAENYLNMVVKPDFDWSEAEEFEERFRACIEQHFA